MLEKYGVENSFQSDLVKEKSKKTMLEKYGVEYFTQNEKFKEKIKEINYKKYGVENVSQSEKIKEKKIQTTLINYGVENPFQSEEIKDKIKVTCLEKYGVEYPSQNELIKKQRIKKYKNKILDKNKIEGLNIIKIKNKDNKNIYTINCEICNNNYNIEQSLLFNRKKYNTILCTICNPINSNISGLEIKMLDFIKENYNGVIVENSRDIIKPYELDVYLPELNLAFEFNGLYWHSELNKPNNYHKDKSNMCEEKNIQLIHIWEDDWIYKQDIIKSMILNKLKKTPNKFFARKCEIKEIKDNKLLKDFLNENHIQGFIGSSIKLGLFYDDELVSLMIFGKKRKFMNSKSKEGEYELLRFCNKLNTNVIGGASKLFKYFIKNYSFTEITTYADRSHSQGKLYETLGFNFISKTEPNYFYIINKIRKHRFSFRKDVLVKEGYDPNKTEHEIMLERKIYKIYNAGNLKFSFNI